MHEQQGTAVLSLPSVHDWSPNLLQPIICMPVSALPCQQHGPWSGTPQGLENKASPLADLLQHPKCVPASDLLYQQHGLCRGRRTEGEPHHLPISSSIADAALSLIYHANSTVLGMRPHRGHRAHWGRRPHHLPISSSIAAAARSPLFFTSSAVRGPPSSQTMYARRCSFSPVFSGKICAAAHALGQRLHPDQAAHFEEAWPAGC